MARGCSSSSAETMASTLSRRDGSDMRLTVCLIGKMGGVGEVGMTRCGAGGVCLAHFANRRHPLLLLVRVFGVHEEGLLAFGANL